MQITTSSIVLFSPTGTSRKIADAVADGCRCQPRIVDATFAEPVDTDFGADEVVFIAVPVYGGKVAPTALQRFDTIQGHNTPAVLIVVYGNRDFEGAMVELDAFVRNRGFVTVAAGAFIGEHSYSTKAHPIAANRPDMADFTDARAWGRDICAKLVDMTLPTAVDVSLLKAPNQSPASQLRFKEFILELQSQSNKPKPRIAIDWDKCNRCGKCFKLCPTQAIKSRTEPDIDYDRCIKCCACVKGCPCQARSFDTPYAPVLSECFAQRKSPVTLL